MLSSTSPLYCRLLGDLPSSAHYSVMHLTFLAIAGLFCLIGFSNSLPSFDNDTIFTCGSTATRNNTNWQVCSSSTSTCALKINIVSDVCQIRLDFISFTTAQPVAGTCVDTFQVTGSSSLVPIICGDNAGQHMYLDVSSSSDVQLLFNLRPDISVSRSWNIKIAMLPCGAQYLAPLDCLQYFTGASGKVKSFNWQDVTTPTIRQLNNQKYNICFRTEFVYRLRATQMCLSVCTVTNGGDAFSITTPAAVVVGNAAFSAISATAADITAAALLSNVGTVVKNTAGDTLVATCLYDFLQIAGGKDATTGVEADRFCGNHLNPATGPTLLSPGVSTSVQVCSAIKPFRMTFRTDGTEAAISVLSPPTQPAFAGADTANTGFCLDYQEK